MPFTDIHCHILPGFDDGARDVEEFLAMAERALQGGTARMVATPHCDLEEPASRWREVRRAVEEHREILSSAGLELELVPGMEVRVNSGLYRMAREGADLSPLVLGDSGRYMLVDLPLMDIPSPTSDILFLVQLRGFVPILAHPERNRLLSDRLHLVREFRERGMEIQVNSGSLTGLYGRKARRAGWALLEEGVARLVASDAHQARGRDPDLSGTHRLLGRRLGEQAAELLLKTNPALVLDGKELHDLPELRRRRTRDRRSSRPSY